MRRSTILFVHYNAHSTGSARERILAILAYVARSHPLIVLLPEEGPLTELLREKGYRVLLRRFHDNEGLGAYFREFWSFIRFCRREKIRLMHILDHVYWKPAELLAAKLLGIPFFSMITFYRPADATQGAVRWAAAIVANSESTAKDFRNAGLTAKTFVVHNAIDSAAYIDAVNIRGELYPEASLLIGYVGVLHPIKGIDTLLRAFAQVHQELPAARLLVLGPEKCQGYAAELRALCGELNLDDLVRFHGYRADIPAVMKSIDLLVVPSREEPFGFVTLEAGAAGRAVVASAVGGIPEVIEDQRSGLLFEPDSVEQLTGQLIRLGKDAALREKLAAELQERVQTQFNFEQMLASWRELYLRHGFILE